MAGIGLCVICRKNRTARTIKDKNGKSIFVCQDCHKSLSPYDTNAGYLYNLNLIKPIEVERRL